MAKSAFRQALEEAIEQRHSAVHPWSEAWTSGKLNRRLLGEWVKQHYHYVSHFAEWVAAVYATCPHQEVQHFLLENVTEEEGFVGMHGAAPVRHSDLLLEFAETCGMPREEILNAQVNGELLAETLGLQSWCAVQSRKPFVEALSGLLIGLESQVPKIYSKTTPPLLEKYGFSEEEVTFFSHPHRRRPRAWREGLRDRREVRHHRRAARDLRAAVKEATMMRRLYLDGVYRKFIAEAEGKKLAA